MESSYVLKGDLTILATLKLMDERKKKLFIIVKEDNKFVGVISLGDIQRAIINQTPLESKISNILRKHITVANTSQSFKEIKSEMLEKRTEAMPVLDSDGYLVKIILWDDVVKVKFNEKKAQLNLPVVIMAGGKGTRLRPLTNVIPKPLIPIGDKTFLEDIMNSFIDYGCEDFYLTVNYKAKMIRYYLDEQVDKNYKYELFKEDSPLGTAGSLHLLNGAINKTFFVSNCDIIIKQDYSEILKYHRENNNELTVVAAMKDYSIPYGTLETGENGLLKSINEKPNLTYKINTGLYILEPHLLQEIPRNEFYHITTLIEKLISENRNVGVFPVSEKSWIDIGEWTQYLKKINE